MFNSNKELNSQKYLIANSEFGDSNLVLLMNIGISNLVIVNFKIQRQVLVWVLV